MRKKLKVEFCATTPRWNFWSNAKIWAWVYSVTQMPIKSILGVPSLEFALSNLCFAKKRGQFMCVAVFSNFKHSVFFYEKINHLQKCERSEPIFLARKFKFNLNCENAKMSIRSVPCVYKSENCFYKTNFFIGPNPTRI